MADIKLIYFKGCPNYESARSLLLNSGWNFEEIDQSELLANHPFKQYTSPAILKNGTLIFGEKMDSLIGGCSMDLPSSAKLKMQLENW